jgi:hypothetical protein
VSVGLRTLRRSASRNPRLTFGIPELPYDPHGLAGTLIGPFADALRSTR